MERKRKTRKVVTYISATITGTPILPIVAPVIMWTNARGYADGASWLPGIQSGGGIVSGLVAFVYVIVFAAVIGGTAFVASGGGAVFNTSSTATGNGPAVGSTTEPTLLPVEDDTTTQNNEANKS